MIQRWDFLQGLIDRYRYKAYLEIGTQKGRTFTRLSVPRKVGVDPVGVVATFHGTSDAFFAQNGERFDLVFIDGLHTAEQVAADVEHALDVLNRGGLIVLHDCNPIAEHKQTHDSPGVGGWNGDVWKTLVRLRSRHELDCATGAFDQGCAVIVRRANTDRLPPVPSSELTWPELVANRQTWLRLMSLEQLTDWIGDLV